MSAERHELARTAGLREFKTPELEDVDRRRSQLWLLSLLVGVAVPAIILALGYDLLADQIGALLDIHTVRLVLVALLVAVFGYIAERERTLRRLAALLVEERVLTASLVARVDELDQLFTATRAMNSSLDLSQVLDVILKSAYKLLAASEGSIQLVGRDDPTMLEVVAVQGASTARMGQRQPIGSGLAGGVARTRDALLVLGQHEESLTKRKVGSALVVPLEIRGELVGVLNLAAGHEREPFTEYDLRSVAVFADTAAGAINNARVHLSTQQTVDALTELDHLKDEFLTMITHELRTPLTSMIGLASTIQSGSDQLERNQIAELAEMARDQGWRLERLVNQVLQTAQVRQGRLRLNPQLVDAADLVQESVDVLTASAKDHTVLVDVPQRPFRRHVDPDAITQIVTNLVSNALKYTPPGSTVEMTLTEWSEGIALVVSDDGPGIPEDIQDRVFEKFFRGDTSDGSGLGLGLYLVRALAQAHGGEVLLHSPAEGGCKFVVTLADLGAPIGQAVSPPISHPQPAEPPEAYDHLPGRPAPGGEGATVAEESRPPRV